MPEIQPLEPVELREAWHHEAHDFTPWLARDFTSYHKSILEWLNEADTIDAYAVTVRAFRVGEALAADFDTVVEPGPDRNGPSLRARKSSSTRYAEFYRPLVTQLRQSKVLPLGGEVGGAGGGPSRPDTRMPSMLRRWPTEKPKCTCICSGLAINKGTALYSATKRRSTEKWTAPWCGRKRARELGLCSKAVRP